MYVAWHVQTIGLCIPRFLLQGDNSILTILRQNQTPQEVVDWFGCEHGKKKKGKENLIWLGKQTLWFVTCVGKNQKKKKMYKRSSGKSPSYPGSCMARFES